MLEDDIVSNILWNEAEHEINSNNRITENMTQSRRNRKYIVLTALLILLFLLVLCAYIVVRVKLAYL